MKFQVLKDYQNMKQGEIINLPQDCFMQFYLVKKGIIKRYAEDAEIEVKKDVKKTAKKKTKKGEK